MSVGIAEVLESAGYDIKNNKEDAEWLLSQVDEFGELVDMADDCIDMNTPAEEMVSPEDVEADRADDAWAERGLYD